MQELLLLSKYILQKGTPYTLWRLHETIETRFKPKAAAAPVPQQPTKKRPRDEEEEEEKEDLDVQGIEDTEEPPTVKKLCARFLPPKTSVIWTSEDMDLVDLNPQVHYKHAYKTYLAICEKRKLPARTLQAFKQKRNLMLKNI